MSACDTHCDKNLIAQWLHECPDTVAHKEVMANHWDRQLDKTYMYTTIPTEYRVSTGHSTLGGINGVDESNFTTIPFDIAFVKELTKKQIWNKDIT